MARDFSSGPDAVDHPSTLVSNRRGSENEGDNPPVGTHEDAGGILRDISPANDITPELISVNPNLVLCVSGEPFYQCGASGGRRALSIPRHTPCKPPPVLITERKEVNVTIWSTNGHLNQILAVRCVLRNRTLCTNTGFFVSKGIVFDQTLQQPVSPSLCRQVWVDKVYHGQRLIRLQPGVWVTNNLLQAKFEWCCKDVCQPTQNFVLETEPELLVTPAEEIDPVAPGSDPINPKLQYLYDKIMEQESRIFKAVWMELCHAAEKHLAMIWQLLKLDPTLGARALLQCNDIVASFAGQALMIWECSPVRPDH
uniref:Uncharacterized protein n=1 Tax=Romanomermis culicivorax TaxID=13658 RepID=A0A915LDX2_ROMCU